MNIEVEGDITVPGAPDEDDEPSTLDEPVTETLVSRSTVIFDSWFSLWQAGTAKPD